ncbi:MAG: hypothetical protein IJJ33_13615 [Victivallales bacterium]|nr:hypothetical protein [Victivallales bacterium]
MMTGLLFLAEAENHCALPIALSFLILFVWFFFDYWPKKMKEIQRRTDKRWIALGRPNKSRMAWEDLKAFLGLGHGMKPNRALMRVRHPRYRHFHDFRDNSTPGDGLF